MRIQCQAAAPVFPRMLLLRNNGQVDAIKEDTSYSRAAIPLSCGVVNVLIHLLAVDARIMTCIETTKFTWNAIFSYRLSDN